MISKGNRAFASGGSNKTSSPDEKEKVTYHLTEGRATRDRLKSSSSRGGRASSVIVSVAAEADAVISPLALDPDGSFVGIAAGVLFVDEACPVAAAFDSSWGALICLNNFDSVQEKRKRKALGSGLHIT